MDSDLKLSPLHEEHLKLKARMVPFAGWQMPVQYEGIMPEHKNVRSDLGVFDISHMGQLFVSGETSAAWLDSILTNNVASLAVGEGQYTFLLNDNGGVIDDLIVYRQSDTKFFLVVNASMIDEDFAWMNKHGGSDSAIEFVDLSSDYAGMAVQGPNSVKASSELFEGAVLPERFCMAEISVGGESVIVCRTGYTGEDGFELFCSADSGPEWWQKCMAAGAKPTGLGARDSLRLEKCYPLNGNDLSPELTPLQAGMGFAVDLTKDDFIGKPVLVKQKADGMPKRLIAIRQTEKSPPPRPGYEVYSGDQCVGTLSSGGVSPILGCGISLAYIEAGHNKIGTSLDVEIRGKRFPATVVKKPFV